MRGRRDANQSAERNTLMLCWRKCSYEEHHLPLVLENNSEAQNGDHSTKIRQKAYKIPLESETRANAGAAEVIPRATAAKTAPGVAGTGVESSSASEVRSAGISPGWKAGRKSCTDHWR